MAVLVTGFGVVSAIGNNVEENLLSLKNSKSGIGKSQFLDSNFAKDLLFGEVKRATKTFLQNLSLKNEKGFTRTDVFALTAVKEAVSMAHLTENDLSSFDTAIVSSSTVGGMVETDSLYNDANLPSGGSEYLSSYGSAVHLVKLVEYFQIKGLTDTINTACSSSANAIMLGYKLIQSKRATRVIVGGTDSLSKFTVNGFNSLQILSKEFCKPFDNNRTGLNLGEGAGYLILESSEVVGDKKVYAEITGYGNSNDAFHPTALSDDANGVVRSISEALLKAKIKESEIDYINTHGTATQNNDATELLGMSKVFSKIPAFNSTKSYTGHTLAASGVIEAIFSILSIQNNELYASLNCEDSISNEGPITKYRDNQTIKHVLSNSFGFGGNCTSLIISKVSIN
jgi:3-oxoacyl-(acyl-carrier-protein) synthase